ncbi:TadE/TadG family type IV pilus assembly protein [Paenibacillus solisilvae]|uniref:TadE/TadG family type IV pilus assembly protein n=1 Tax=Paenibacillus solisilvae TaxID=2486751 RepID=A0ABW0VRA5_9BACL
MKRQKLLAGHTVNLRSETGSIALEASLIMPIVLMVFIFFICLIRLSAVQMALHGTLSQTVRQAAANIYPVELAYNKAVSSMPPAAEPSGAGTGALAAAPLPGIEMVADKLEGWLPSPAGRLLAAVLEGDWKPVVDAAATEIGRSVVEPLLRHEADRAVLNPELLRLSRLSLPDLKGKTEAYIRIEAEYTFKLGFPFTKRSLTLREQAEERVWVSDPVPANRDGEGTDSTHAQIQIVSLEPDPLRPGNKARLVVQTDPGRILNLTVTYKSGRSQAKHVGEVSADASGKAEWTWLVSGNTTPGVWELSVSAADGTTVSRHFVVEKKKSA